MNMTSLPSRALAAKLVALFAICSGAFVTADQAKANIITNASDNAGNYSGGWTNGANGGTGFGAWAISFTNGTNFYSGAFVGNPTNAGIVTNAFFGNPAFGLYANPAGSPAYVNADRNLTAALQVGQTFSFQWAVNYDAGSGNKGFNVYSGGTGGSQIVNVNQGPFPGNITVNGSDAITNYGAGAMTWAFTRTSSTNLLVTSTARDGSTNIVFSTNIAISAPPNAFRWYASGLDAGDERQPYFNNLQIAGPAPTIVTNQVTFSVDMSYQASQGLFSSNSDTVLVRGSFDEWSTNNLLTNQGNNIYAGTFQLTGSEGDSVAYKFWNSSLTNTESQGYEGGSDRSLLLGTNGTTTNLPVVFFSNLAGQRFVTFSVNMAIQEGKGVFNPAVNTNVQVRGDFNGWVGNQLTNQGGSVYSGSFLLSSSATNSNLGYKFFYASGTNDVWEGGGNRSFDLVFNSDGSNAPALALATNFFSDELFYATPTSLSGFTTTQGTPSAEQSFTVVGLGLSTNIAATAPVGFELSADSGVSYTNSLSLAPSSGAYSNSVLARIAASATLGSFSNNIQLASLGSAEASVLVTGNVTAAGQTFSNWAGGAPLNSANLLLYSIGGASSPSATNGVPPVSALNSNTLSITAIVRTNDPNLSVAGQAVTDLSNGVWSTNDVSMTPGDQTGVGEGLQKQIWSVPRASDTKKFLRLRSVLTNN